MQELLNLIDSILGTHKRHPKGEFYYSCPFCHHSSPKLAINLDKRGAWHCWHCNERGGKLVSLFHKLNCTKEEMSELYRLLNDDTSNVTEYTPSTTILTLPPEYKPLYVPPKTNMDFEYRTAMRYTLNRGLTAADILRYQIGYCVDGAYKGRIIIPSYDELGKLNYFIARSYYETSTMKYKNPTASKNVVAFEFHINWKHPLVLVEGVYDAIAVKRNAIPLLGKTIPNKLLQQIYAHNVKQIYLALDTDALSATADIASLLVQNGLEVRLVPLDGKDPSEIGFSRMVDLIKQAKPLSFADLIKLRVTA